MPSSSSPGLMPINASTAAWRSRRTSSGSESAKNQSVRVVWLATRLFQSSDIEPPMTFRCPRNFDTSWTCTSGSDLGGFFVFIRYVLMLDIRRVAMYASPARSRTAEGATITPPRCRCRQRRCHCARRDGRSSTQYPFLAHPALDPRDFAFAVQPDWANLVAERDLVASRAPAMGADHLGASLGMEICVPTVRTVPNLIFQCVN